MNQKAKLWFKGMYVMNTAWKYVGEDYGIMNKLNSQNKEFVKFMEDWRKIHSMFDPPQEDDFERWKNYRRMYGVKREKKKGVK